MYASTIASRGVDAVRLTFSSTRNELSQMIAETQVHRIFTWNCYYFLPVDCLLRSSTCSQELS